MNLTVKQQAVYDGMLQGLTDQQIADLLYLHKSTVVLHKTAILQRKAMKMALDKLEHLWEIGIDAEYKVELLPEIKALRQALQRPVKSDTKGRCE